MSKTASHIALLNTLRDFDAEVAQLQFSEVARRALEFIHARLGIKRISIALLKHEASGFMLYDVTREITEIESGAFIPFEKTILSEVVRSTEPLYRTNIKSWETTYEVDSLLLEAGFRSDFLIPLIINKQCIGTLNAGAMKVNGISESKRHILQLIAPRLAQAIQSVLYIESILESEKKYRRLVESIEETHFIYSHGTDGVFTYLSPSITKILGYSPDEFLTHYTRYLTDNPTNKEVQHHTDLSIKGIKQPPYEVEIYHKDDGIRWLEVSEAPVVDSANTVVAVQGIAHDITKRKEAEEAISRARDFYLTLFEDFPSLIWRAGVDAKCNYFNKTWLEFTGRTLEQELGDGWAEGVHPEDVDRCVKIYLYSFEARNPFEMEYRLRHHSGEYRWITDMGQPFFDHKGSFAGYIGSCYDITERRTAEMALQESESRYKKLVDSVTDYIYTVGISNGKPVSTKHWPGCVAVTGYTSEEYNWDPYLWYRMVHEDDREMVKQHAEKVLSGEAVQSIEHRIIHKNGDIKWVRNTPVLRYDHDGALIAYDGLIENITERKLAEEGMQKERDAAQNYLNIAAVMLIAIAADQKVTLINKKGCELLGYREDEIIGRNWFDNFIPGKNRQTIKDVFGQLMRGESALAEYYENPVLTKGGEEKVIAWHSTLIRDGKNRITGTLSSGEDITDRKRIEEEREKLQEQLMHAQKMEAVGMLAGGVAHDFNNILTAIIGYSSIVKMKIRSDDPMKINLDRIISSAERGAGLTQSLLAFSRKQLISPRPIDLNIVINNVQKLLSRIIREDIELKTEFCDRPLTIMADSGQLEQIVMNLTTNARDAMPQGGSLTITTDTLLIDEQFIKDHGFGEPGEYAVLSLKDTGTGMDSETMDRIFEPFFTTKEVGRGTGLGLAMVYGAVKQNNGYIAVFSEIGKGTTFSIYLPLITLPAKDDKLSQPVVLIKGGTETILVAEDDESLRSLISSVLSEFDYTVIEAKDGIQAIELFKKHKENIAMAILDVVMPGKNGKEVCDELLKLNPGLKSLFISGYTADVVHKRGVLDLEINFLQKPLMPAKLLNKVREILDNSEDRKAGH